MVEQNYRKNLSYNFNSNVTYFQSAFSTSVISKERFLTKDDELFFKISLNPILFNLLNKNFHINLQTSFETKFGE